MRFLVWGFSLYSVNLPAYRAHSNKNSKDKFQFNTIHF